MPEKPPPTIGEFVAQGWKMRGGCYECFSINDWWIDMAAEVAKFGAGKPLDDWMLAAMCPKCGKKLGLGWRSPNDTPLVVPGRKWPGIT
jgi:hypothetical protein